MGAKRRRSAAAPLVSCEQAREVLLDMGSHSSDAEETALPAASVLGLLKWDRAETCTSNAGKLCKGARKDSVRCFCAAAPPKEGSHRKEGLWAANLKNAVLEKQLGSGHDPSAEAKKDQNLPTGLRNLGNTCYVNGALQCLFSNTCLRRALFGLDAEWLESTHAEALRHLRHLFAEMQSGPRAVADPSAFAKYLELETGVQQDGMEFLKLLLTHLEAKLAGSPQASLLEQLYAGKQSFSTTCKACGRQSSGSQSSMPFYDLQVPVQGSESLQSSMAELLTPELLDGDNKYHCEFCASKVDAERQLRLRSLPPYLCFSLMRFVYNMTTFARVKVSNKFAFPLELDMGGMLSSDAPQLQNEYEYELSAVLLHKGSNATSGHYVAQVKNELDGCWWEFNDEEVKPLGSQPSGCGSSAEPKPGQGQQGSKKDSKSTKRKSENKKQGESEDAASELLENGGSGADFDGMVSSKDAYVLVYRLKGFRNDAQGQPAEGEGRVPALDAELTKYIDTVNSELMGRTSAYKDLASDVASRVQQRKDVVRSAFDALCSADGSGEAPIVVDDDTAMVDASEGVRFLDSESLAAWVNTSGYEPELQQGDAKDPKPVDMVSNAGLLCEHGKLKLGQDTRARIRAVPAGAWTQLKGIVPVTPELSPADVCWPCLRAELEQLCESDENWTQLQSAVKKAKTLLEDLDDPSGSGTSPSGRERPCSGQRALVPAQWLKAWVSRKGSISHGSKSPTAAITCPHQTLRPSEACGGKLPQMVPMDEDVWAVMCEAWRQAGGFVGEAKPDGLSEVMDKDEKLMIEIREGHPECGTCRILGTAAEHQATEEHEQRAKEREAVPLLVKPVPNIFMEEGTEWKMIPTVWLEAWRSYVDIPRTRKASNLPDRPGPLLDALECLACSCEEHRDSPRLNCPPPTLEIKRGRPVVVADRLIGFKGGRDPNDPRQTLTPITPESWAVLSSLYPAQGDTQRRFGDQGISARVVSSISNAPDSNGDGGDSAQSAKAAKSGVPELEVDPPVCHATLEARKEAGEAEALNFAETEICLELADSEESAVASSLAVEPLKLGETRRFHKSRRQGRAVVTAASTDTVEMLRARASEALELHPRNLKLYLRGSLLPCSDATLKSSRVFPQDHLFVVDTQEFDNDDVTSMIVLDGAEGRIRSKQQVERGFQSSILMGS